MDDPTMKSRLRSAGKECFVTYFTAFCDFARSDEDVAKQIHNETGASSISALHRRVRGAREIIKAGRGRKALINCSQSRLPPQVKDLATALALASEPGVG